jgi:hypothetical protein
MNHLPNLRILRTALLVAVVGSVALVGCKKKEEPTPETTPAPAVVEPAPAPAAPPAPAATASVASVDLGTAVGADGKLSATATGFKPKDKIVVSIGTNTSDPAATVAGKIDAKLSFINGAEVMEVKTESRDFNLAGAGNTNVEFSKPDGWPVGKYKVEVSLDGALVQTKEFDVTK